MTWLSQEGIILSNILG